MEPEALVARGELVEFGRRDSKNPDAKEKAG